MKTQPPAPIRTVYYTDERTDEFSSAEIEPRRIDESYRYIDPRPGWKAARFIAYRLFAMPAAFLYCKLALHARFENRQVLKEAGKLQMALRPAVELSYLTRDEQAELWDLIGREDATPSLSQALRIKQLSRAAKLTPEVLYAILTEEKPNQKEQVRIKTESLRKYFPRNYSAQQMERAIIKLLEARYRAKGRGER